MVSTFLEKKNITETSKQEEEVISNVAFTVYGGSYLITLFMPFYNLIFISQRRLIL